MRFYYADEDNLLEICGQFLVEMFKYVEQEKWFENTLLTFYPFRHDLLVSFMSRKDIMSEPLTKSDLGNGESCYEENNGS